MLRIINISTLFLTILISSAHSFQFFDSWRDYPMGDYIGAMTSADFNNDGYVDFAIGPKYSLFNLKIYLNNGDGTFLDATEVYGGTRPTFIGHGDFDGDGWIDLFTVSNNKNDLNIIMNQGDGTFMLQQSYEGYGSAGITVIDMNNDGFDDILISSGDLYFSNGDGTLAIGDGGQDIVYLLFESNGYILAWDVNHDDYQDLLLWGNKIIYTDSVNYYQQQLIATFVNNGDTTFLPAVEYLYGDSNVIWLNNLEIAYFNGDSEKDLLITDTESNRSILINNNDGSFSLAGSFVKESQIPLKPGDVNGDGYSDLIFPDSKSARLSIMLNSGSDEISFTDSIDYSGKYTTNPTFLVNLLSTDVNNDKYDDIIEYDWTLSPIINHGDGTFPILKRVEDMGTDAVDLLAEDFNNDGFMDIITIDGHVYISYNDGYGNFSEPQNLGTAPDGKIFSGYFNDDAIMDFGVTGLDGFILYYSQEEGGFQASSAILNNVDNFYSGYGGLAANFNEDGFIDFATYYSSSLMLNILLSDSMGVYHVDSYPMSLTLATDISIADIDDDGDLDIATSSHNNIPENQSGAISVRLNDGNGQFPTLITMPTEFYAMGVVLEDLNNDGYADIAAVQLGAAYEGYVSVFLNNGDSTFTETENWAQLDAPKYESIKAADMDGDRDPDLLAINSGYNEVVVLLNEGDGTFPEAHYYTGGDNPVAFDLADFDNDSTMDVAVISSISDRDFVFIFQNNGFPLILPPPPDSTQKGNVIITEINYHSSLDFDSGDWIEIYNNADSVLNLTSWQFLDPTSHIFKFQTNFLLNPDSYFILCKDTIKFKENYPSIKNILGNFNFELGNEGDLIKILNQDDFTIDEVEYSNSAPFPVNANGTGRTIELIDLAKDNNVGENWIAGNLYGTPGAKYEIISNLNSDNSIPKKFSLEQNYPNPFNPKTVITYQLPANNHVELSIFNILGQKVATLFSKKQLAGYYKVEWDASHFSSGIYFYQLKTDNHLFTHKMLLLK